MLNFSGKPFSSFALLNCRLIYWENNFGDWNDLHFLEHFSPSPVWDEDSHETLRIIRTQVNVPLSGKCNVCSLTDFRLAPTEFFHLHALNKFIHAMFIYLDSFPLNSLGHENITHGSVTPTLHLWLSHLTLVLIQAILSILTDGEL